eukprot:6963230-Pyramimonas_sp.AAC.2
MRAGSSVMREASHVSRTGQPQGTAPPRSGGAPPATMTSSHLIEPIGHIAPITIEYDSCVSSLSSGVGRCCELAWRG